MSRSRLPLPDAIILRMYEDGGMTAKEIAEDFGASERTILDRLHQCGAKMRRPGPRNPFGPKSNRILPSYEVLVELRRAGMSQREIGEEFGVTRQAVSAALKHGRRYKAYLAKKGR